MASVVRMLFGLHPPFLELKSKKSLFQTISHLPSYGISTKVQPTSFYQQGKTKNYYIVTKVFPISKHVYGVRIRNGRKMGGEMRICDKFNNWGIFHDPKQIDRINKAFE